MTLKKIFLWSVAVLMINTAQAKVTELDQYFVNKQILDSSYKIKDRKALNEILDVISDEDSRTLPYQVDQNMLLEQFHSYADHIVVKGSIITPDFTQFAEDMGDQKVRNLIKQNLIQNCDLFFENQFQRVNPYNVDITLNAEKKNYKLKIKNSECSF